jgi:hypothetical protein
MIRNDFVSNSSSSSFIISKNEIFNFGKITKDDLQTSLIELYGKDEFEKRDHKPFEIYDLTNEIEAKKCHEKYDSFLNMWISESNPYYEDFSTTRWYLKQTGLDIKQIMCYLDDLKEVILDRIYNPKTNSFDKEVSQDIIDMVRVLKKYNYLETMKEALYNKDALYFIHFDDNELWNIQHVISVGYQDIDKIDLNDLIKKLENIYKDSKESLMLVNKSIFLNDLISRLFKEYKSEFDKIECQWKTEHYTAERFFEVLIEKLYTTKNIKLDDEKLLSTFREKNKDGKFDPLTPWELIDVLNVDYVLHEG